MKPQCAVHSLWHRRIRPDGSLTTEETEFRAQTLLRSSVHAVAFPSQARIRRLPTTQWPTPTARPTLRPSASPPAAVFENSLVQNHSPLGPRPVPRCARVRASQRIVPRRLPEQEFSTSDRLRPLRPGDDPIPPSARGLASEPRSLTLNCGARQQQARYPEVGAPLTALGATGDWPDGLCVSLWPSIRRSGELSIRFYSTGLPREEVVRCLSEGHQWGDHIRVN